MQRFPAFSTSLLITALTSWLPGQSCTETRLDTGPAGAHTSVFPVVAASGPAVYATWLDQRNGALDVYFNRSLDGGSTWLPADVRLESDAPGASMSFFVTLAASGMTVIAAWSDSRNGSADIYCNRSLDGGVTWLANDIRLDTDLPGANTSTGPVITIDGSVVYASWQDNRNGSSDIYFNRSLDGGASWLATDVRLDTDAPGASTSETPRIGADGAAVCVAWEEQRGGERHVQCNRSLDGGTTWLAADVQVDQGVLGFGGPNRMSLEMSGTTVHVAWKDSRNGIARDVYYNRSIDGGATWLPNDTRLDTDPPAASDSQLPQIVASGSSISVVWQDSRDGGSIYHNRSTNGGVTWQATDTRLDDGVGVAAGPQLVANGSSRFVTWRELAGGSVDLVVNYSGDGGATWLGERAKLTKQPSAELAQLDGVLGACERRGVASGVAGTAASSPYPPKNRCGAVPLVAVAGWVVFGTDGEEPGRGAKMIQNLRQDELDEKKVEALKLLIRIRWPHLRRGASQFVRRIPQGR